MTTEARKAALKAASWPVELPSASMPWMPSMLATTCAGLQVAETMGRAWAGFLGERVKCWEALRADLGRCASVEDAMKVQSAYLTETGRAYIEAMSDMSAAAGRTMREELPDIATPPMEQRRAA